LVVERSGDIGSPRSCGSTNASSAGTSHLRRVLAAYEQHYDTHRTEHEICDRPNHGSRRCLPLTWTGFASGAAKRLTD
jgi:hypothetical protein